MSPPRIPGPRRLAPWLAGVLGLAALGAVILGLPSAAPRVGDPGAGLPGVDVADATDPVTCERTLPDVPPAAADTTAGPADDDPRPVGRVSSGELLECPDRFDGRRVSYVGEVVGDVLERGDGAWVLMNDDAYALELGPLTAHGRFRGYNSGVSVWLDGDLAELADEPGRAGRRGDVLEVRGVVRRADPADGGGLTIRAAEGELVAHARELETPVHVLQAIVAGVLAVVALGVVVVGRLADRRH